MMEQVMNAEGGYPLGGARNGAPGLRSDPMTQLEREWGRLSPEDRQYRIRVFLRLVLAEIESFRGPTPVVLDHALTHAARVVRRDWGTSVWDYGVEALQKRLEVRCGTQDLARWSQRSTREEVASLVREALSTLS